MATLNPFTQSHLTQSHLSVLVLDKDSHNPIVRMPIYAEFSIVEELPPYKISEDDLGAIAENSDFIGNETIGAALRSSLAQYIEENTFRELDDEKKQTFLRQIVKILEREAGIFSKSESEIKDIVNRAVLEAMDEFEIRQSQTPSKKSISSYPLGYLATDHVGYASFDLTRISLNVRSVSLSRDRRKTSYAFFLYPMGKEGTRFDALEQGRLTDEAIFAKLLIDQPTLTRDLKILNLPSMQKPSLIDWYFSPGSFAAHPEFLVGEDGCERLFPPQIALQEFNLRQVVRIVDNPPVALPEGYKFAYVDDYRVTWHSLGHSLGEILYSLPLAPGESVKLAVIDWSWESTTQRTEQTALTEEVLHRTHRDRTISETVKAGLRELQKGSSFMGGIAGSAGATGTMGVASGAIGIAGSLGGATATSEGSRDLVGENVQRLNDSFSQASSAQRELNSTVVIQARQEEKESIQTRTFTNYNHSHTLTILYYEVLRHFKVTVELVRRKAAVLVKEDQTNFDDKTLIIYRPILEANLLDERLRSGFNALEKLLAMQIDDKVNPKIKPIEPLHPRKYIFSTFFFNFKVDDSEVNDAETSDPVFISALLNDGTEVDIKYKGDKNLNKEDDLFDNVGTYEIAIQPEDEVEWGKLVGFNIWVGGDDNLNLSQVGFRGTGEFGSIVQLREFTGPPLTFIDQGKKLTVTVASPGPDLPIPSTPPTPEQRLSIEENAAIELLHNHVNHHATYYHRLITLTRDPNLIANSFASLPWDQTDQLIDHVEPYPLEVFGSYVAFPLVRIEKISVDFDKKHSEKLITLPTRGVFAEGKLGHCNISEEIDNTRFWKWEEHPIPFEAPGINPVTPVTPQPQQTNIAPTAFPSSLVNIVNPSAAPDPTGLAAALTVLGTPDIFRDMSGRQEVADLLKKLSDNTISIADAANQAKEIQNKYGENLDKQQKDYDLGIYKAKSDLIGKAIEADAKRIAEANAKKEEADAKKAEVDAANAQAEAAKNIPVSMRKPVYQAAANTLAGNPTKEKVVVFKAVGFNNQTIDGAFNLTVRDVVAQTNVIAESNVVSYYDKLVVFKSPEPVLEAQVERKGTVPIKIEILNQTISLPYIKIVPKNNSYSVGKSHRVINITLTQASRDVSFKAKSTDSAVNELMNKWGAEFGVDKVVAAKMVEDYEQKKQITHTTEEETSYSFNVPTQNYDLVITSK